MTDVTISQEQDGLDLRPPMSSCCASSPSVPAPGGLQLTGEGGLLGKLTKMVVEGALEAAADRDRLAKPHAISPRGQAIHRAGVMFSRMGNAHRPGMDPAWDLARTQLGEVKRGVTARRTPAEVKLVLLCGASRPERCARLGRRRLGGRQG